MCYGHFPAAIESDVMPPSSEEDEPADEADSQVKNHTAPPAEDVDQGSVPSGENSPEEEDPPKNKNAQRPLPKNLRVSKLTPVDISPVSVHEPSNAEESHVPMPVRRWVLCNV